MRIYRYFGYFLEVEADTNGLARESSQETVVIALTTSQAMTIGIEGKTRNECNINLGEILKWCSHGFHDMIGSL